MKTVWAHPFKTLVEVTRSRKEFVKVGSGSPFNADPDELDGLARTCGACILDSGPNHLIYWPKRSDIPELVHELIHSANYTLRNAGVKPCSNNAESLCYLVEYMLHELTRKK